MQDSVAALLPAYRESAHIGEVVRQTRLHLQRVVVVDDASPDKTGEEAAQAGAQVLRHSVNQGKGAAIKTGLKHLLEEPFSHFLLLDADGQHDPSEIPRFFAALRRSGAELIIGNRLSNPQGMPIVRRWTNQFMSWQISRLSRVKIPDSQCGFRLVSRPLASLLLTASDGFEFETEMILMATRRGHSLESVPVTTIYRTEQSKIRPIRDTLRYLKLLRRYRN
jgi:glycosyltransferase involved in cell wall biosynthesis